MLVDETTLRLLTNYALAHQPPTLRQAQALVDERKRQAAPPPPEDPAATARAVQQAAIVLASRAGISAGIAAGLAYGRVEARRGHAH